MDVLMTFLDDPDVLEAYTGLVARNAGLLEMSLDHTIHAKAAVLGISCSVFPAVVADNGTVMRCRFLCAHYRGTCPCDFVKEMNKRLVSA